MKKSKVLLPLLTLVSVFGLASCGGDTTSSTGAGNDNTSQEADDNGSSVTEPEFGYQNPTNDFSHWENYDFDDYRAEDVSKKTITYQFADGVLDFAGQITYNFCMNLYSDGFVEMLQYGLGADNAIIATIDYLGNWDYDEQNEVLSVSLVWSEGDSVDPATQEATKSHHDDNFGFEITLDDGVLYATVPCDKYFNVFHDGSVEMTCDGTIEYESFDAFKTAISA